MSSGAWKMALEPVIGGSGARVQMHIIPPPHTKRGITELLYKISGKKWF